MSILTVTDLGGARVDVIRKRHGNHLVGVWLEQLAFCKNKSCKNKSCKNFFWRVCRHFAKFHAKNLFKCPGFLFEYLYDPI